MRDDCFNPAGNDEHVQSDESTRRRFGRLEQEAVSCSLGHVLDLSAQGMRLITRKVPQGVFTTRLTGLGEDVTLTCRVVWVRRNSLLTKEVGVEFLDLTPDLSQQLCKMAMTNRHRRAM